MGRRIFTQPSVSPFEWYEIKVRETRIPCTDARVSLKISNYGDTFDSYCVSYYLRGVDSCWSISKKDVARRGRVVGTTFINDPVVQNSYPPSDSLRIHPPPVRLDVVAPRRESIDIPTPSLHNVSNPVVEIIIDRVGAARARLVLITRDH